MSEYTKPWSSLEEQVEKLAARGVDVEPRERTVALLGAVGYYRLTGYLYPLRKSEKYIGEEGQTKTKILSDYRPGASVQYVAQVINFDRHLRLLVMDGVERFEVAFRMRIGYVLGRRSAFAHLKPENFLPNFVVNQKDDETGWLTQPSKHTEWLQRVAHRLNGSDEAFVAHFKENYDGQIPIWALTELLELGHLSRLYQGLSDDDAQEIASAFGVPTKKLMASWLASVNYVRNVAAHHARLFNRKLQNAPSRPKAKLVPLLDHLRDENPLKGGFGVYNALAVIAYLLRSIDDSSVEWCRRVMELLKEFPASSALTLESLGVPKGWEELGLWQSVTSVEAGQEQIQGEQAASS